VASVWTGRLPSINRLVDLDHRAGHGMRGCVGNTHHDRSEGAAHSDGLVRSADHDQTQVCGIDAFCTEGGATVVHTQAESKASAPDANGPTVAVV
jgi:hypothetical protein